LELTELRDQLLQLTLVAFDAVELAFKLVKLLALGPVDLAPNGARIPA
jgi:hypothetical protein